MSQKIIVGPINKGQRTDRTPFVIDNDSFPVLTNAYQWRGRVKRKRGTSLLNRLSRYFNSSSTAYNTGSSTITFDGSGNANLLTGFGLTTATPNASIVPGSVSIVGATGPVTYTDPTLDGYLTPTGTGGPNTINYATGAILIPAQAGATATATFIYYPTLPVMGLEDFVNTSLVYPGTLAFDTLYSYNVTTTFPYTLYDVSFYKNPPASGSLPGYTAKTTITPTSWNGQDYQQFYTVNYQGALWACNGITVPFTTANIGMQYKAITNASISAGGPPAIVVLTIASSGLVPGDFLFINEIVGMTGINFQTGYVTAVSGSSVTVEFPNATIGGAYSSGGIAQYLTNRVSNTIDCIRWYDGDPTNGSATNPVLNNNLGWVNFCPPISQGVFSIADLPPAQYYLVGARLIVPFKDRLLFFGPVVQTSSANSQVYLQDTVIYSQNGTPYYTASYTNYPSASADTPVSAGNVFNPLLVPVNQTATSPAYFCDQTGFGGYISAGVDLPIVTVSNNEDNLIVGFFNRLQTKLVYSGNDIVPFNFFIINSELGSSSTFSTVNLDKGVLTLGNRGFVITNQTNSQRFDLEIPDSVFEINLTTNGNERTCAQRDFISEWIYFTYPSNKWNNKYPNQTLFYNYRDDSWAVFNECYTTYGTFRRKTGFTWATVGTVYPTWNNWNAPWNSSQSTLLNPDVIGGNQQGFILFRDSGTTNEATSLAIQNITSNTVTCPNHCLNEGDYITISGVLGTIGPNVNGNVYSVGVPITSSSFTINPTVPTGSYSGGGYITRMYKPFIQTKQFPVAWEMGRKTRLGVQQYLLTKTANSQITLLIYLSQAGNDPFNDGPIVPTPGSFNNSLIYDTVLFTCPESANIGLTPANTNLQMLSQINATDTGASSPQQQIWHRVNTSLVGDTVQVALTMSDNQMRDPTLTYQFAEIELHTITLDVSPSGLLA